MGIKFTHLTVYPFVSRPRHTTVAFNWAYNPAMPALPFNTGLDPASTDPSSLAGEPIKLAICFLNEGGSRPETKSKSPS
ncbi:hypothetical protein EYZ11_004918 [Aspergillus tanneri]|uniref:Uncharacterized protein n=1 Tax=Aspergillus tanneri TaxID=1220188 RepID=A0A4S3JJG5_9EURO|nr:hypothetical protein EYZ11_004918 [Aspergillus tanneri]